jgi:GAF domain-containing protein
MNADQKKHVMALATGFMNGSMPAQAFYEALTEAIATGIGCSRASLWRYGSELLDTAICLDLYDSGDGVHHSGAVLREDDFGDYFEAMRRDALIVASNARAHEATACFNELYFEPNGIYSLLDVGIQVGGAPWGLFCCEQVTFEKDWTPDHVDFLKSVGTLCGLALKKVTM